MSSDTGKENASVVDSSVTDVKHDVDNMNDPESSSHKRSGEAYSPTVEVRGHSHDCVTKSGASRKSKLYETRYFIIKSLNHENIQLSIQNGIWATQLMNEPILEEAYRSSGKVILIFSVNMSGFFQGYAQMMSPVGWRRDNVWSQGSGRNPWGRSFKVEWLRLHDLPFQKTLHLKNPLNDYKPVKISRDCQELPQGIGEALCDLLDGKDDNNANLERDDPLLKRPFVELQCAVPNAEWGPTPVLHPSLFYRHLAEASRYPFTPQLPLNSGSSKATLQKREHIDGSHISSQLDQQTSAFDGWGWSSERSPYASTLTEDEILDMALMNGLV